MAGDAISATTQYYYEGATTNNNSLATNVVTALVAAFNGSAAATAATHGASTTALSTQLSGSGLPAITDPHQYSNDNARRAYLTVLFFDERFNYVSDGSSYQRVQAAGDNATPLVLANIKAPKNGYAYVYVSNESDEPVYFDNLQVAHNRGRIIEENHYYAYGLKIAGISSHKLADPNEGNTENKYLYNDKELDDEGDLNWLDYGFRNYDPQIGRFVQVDPLTDEMPDMSTYHYAYNDPIGNIDKDGLIGVGVLGQVACQGSSGLLQGISTFVGQLGAAIGSVSSLTLSIISTTASIAGNVGKHIEQNDRIGKQVGNQKPNLPNIKSDPAQEVRDRIVKAAKSKLYSPHDYDIDKEKDNFPAGKNKCNKLVYDVLNEAGGSPGTPNGNTIGKLFGKKGTSPPTAGQWADPNYLIPHWRILKFGETPIPGDVVAEKIDYADATGHVGIVVGKGLTISQWSEPYEIAGQNDYGFRGDGSPHKTGRFKNAVFRRYVP